MTRKQLSKEADVEVEGEREPCRRLRQDGGQIRMPRKGEMGGGEARWVRFPDSRGSPQLVGRRRGSARARARATDGEASLWWCTTGTPSTVPLALYKVRHFELPHCRRGWEEWRDGVGFERWGKG